MMQESTSNSNPLTLESGCIFGAWKIVKKLGEGGFGSVYKVKRSNSTAVFALKTESLCEVTRVLKNEILVLKSLHVSGSRHCCNIIEAGSHHGYDYMVMTLTGKTLQHLRKSCSYNKINKFTLPSALQVGKECLHAIRDLHRIGYVHRDIKPSNFAIGLHNPRQIYILDFGLCKKVGYSIDPIRIFGLKTAFQGTIKYASLDAHTSRDASFKNDLESWLYQQIEFTNGKLPWKKFSNFNEIQELKKKCRTTEASELFKECPKEYILILMYLDGLHHFEQPNYEKIENLLKEAFYASGNFQIQAYDWEVRQITKKVVEVQHKDK